MEKSFSESYKAAGVDITAGYKAVELMKEHGKDHDVRKCSQRYRRLWRPV